MEVSRLANRLMASRTGANGVDIDGRHQFIDYPLWQASRFESCSDSHARARCRRRANADRRFAQDRLGRRRSRRRGYFLSGDGSQVCGSGNSSARSGRARVAAAGWLMLWPGRSRRVAIGSHRRLLAVALGLETTDVERPQTRYAKSGDVNVAYQVIGDGPFDLIFAPGFVSNLEYGWEEPSLERFYRRLASFCRLVIFDKRGTGLSDRVAGLADLETRMDDVRALMDAINATRLRLGAGPAAAALLWKMAMTTDVPPLLPSIKVPALIIHRVGDRNCDVRNGRYAAEHIPDSTYVEPPGDDHLPWVGDSEAIAREIERFLTGVWEGGGWEERVPERVLTTVLFTDIVGSTSKSAELGDSRWRALIEKHHAVVRKHLARFRGRELDTAGDGFFASFDGPARAIRCASALTVAVRELGLEIRAGLHTGECEMVDGKVGGIAVHIGARVAGEAGPGEVLVSGTVKDLVAGSGLQFEDRGVAELKGVPGEWRAPL